jgi:hypothetical protein
MTTENRVSKAWSKRDIISNIALPFATFADINIGIVTF